MRIHNRQSNQRNGMVTALILLVSIILMLLGMATILISRHERTFAVRSAQIIAAKSAADSGLTQALNDFDSMIKSGSVDLSLLDVSGISVLNSDATFDYTVSETNPGEYEVVSTGHSQGTARTVRAAFKLKGLFDNAIFVKNQLSCAPGSKIVGINSSDPFDTDLDVTIGTASTGSGKVDIGSLTVVNGDAFAGFGGNPATVITGIGTITGDKYALQEEPLFPVITPPSFGTTQPAIAVSGTTKTLTPANSGRYSGVTVTQSGPSSGKLLIDAGKVVLHITGNVSIADNCKVVINAGASLVLYLDGNYSTGVDAGIENKAGPESLQVYGTGTGSQLFQFKPKVETFGLVYAPNATVEMKPMANIKGSIVAYNFRLLTNSSFVYDKAVQQVSADQPGARLVLDRWSE